jgi:hypothetical protein
MTFSANRIAPRLWQGSVPLQIHPAYPPFNLVVLAAKEYQLPGVAFPYSAILRVPLDDTADGMHKHEPELIENAATIVAKAWRSGHRSLITCAMGLNRSGLLMARTLTLLGVERELAIHTVQLNRPGALYNQHFLRYLRSR